MRQANRFALLLCAAVLLQGATDLSMAAAPKKIAEVEGITEYQLDNGLRLLLFPDRSKPTVTVNLTIFVGSRHEGYGETGMAHLLEHMMFKGTPTHPDIDKLMQQRGARFNGSTWTDRTNYFETLPASDDNLEFAIRLEADRMVNSPIREEDLASEMTVVRNEFERGENSPRQILVQRMQATAYQWHNYGKPTIGNRSDIEGVPARKLRAFYRKYYQPDNAMLIIAGRFDPEKALAYAQKYFGSIPRPDRQLEETYTEEPPQDGERTVVLRRVGQVGLVGVAYHIPASPHPDFAPVYVLSYILAMEPAGRLYKALVETGKAASVAGWAYAFHDPGLMIMMAEVRQDSSLEEVRQTLITQIEQLGQQGVTAEEVERARQQILKRREQEMADTTRLAVSLSNWAAQGDWRLYFLFRDRIEQVTPDDVRRVAARYLRRNNRTVGLFIPTDKPQRVEIPPAPDVQELVADYRGRQTVEAGEFFDPSPDNIETRTLRETVGGNVRATLLPKKTRGGMVHVLLTLRFGNAENLKGLETACQALAPLMARGTRDKTHQQIQDELDKKRTTLRASGSLGVAQFQLQTKREYLTDAMQLLEEILRHPALPADELQLYRRQRLAQLEELATDPQHLAITRLRRLVSPYPKDSVRYVPTVEEQIQRWRELTLAQLQQLHQQYLGSQAGELAIVGDFDPQQIRPLLHHMLDDWQAPQPYAHVPIRAFTDVPGVEQSIRVPDKANAAYFAGEVFAMSDRHPDYAALLIGNYILGGSTLASRLGERVRQQEGLSYGIFSGLRAEPLDERASLTIGAIANPDNIPKLAELIRQELQRLLRDGVTPQELERAQQGYLERQTVRRSNDSTLAFILADTSYAGRTMQYHKQLEAAIRSLKPHDVLEALRRHIDPKRLVVVTAGDFK